MHYLLIFLVLLFSSFEAIGSRIEDKSIGWPGETLDGKKCTGKEQGYGPYDYVRSPRKHIKIVEQYHFNRDVEKLVRGQTGTVDSDLDYTLRAIPNHHRALWSMIRLWLDRLHKLSSEEIDLQRRAGKFGMPAECYLHRANVFAPEDGTVDMLFGIYLHKLGKHELALKAYSKAVEAMPINGEAHYNLGLLYFDMENYAEAEKHAREAKRLGYRLTGLERKLKKVHAAAD